MLFSSNRWLLLCCEAVRSGRLSQRQLGVLFICCWEIYSGIA